MGYRGVDDLHHVPFVELGNRVLKVLSIAGPDHILNKGTIHPINNIVKNIGNNWFTSEAAGNDNRCWARVL
jgi:hypothetical protein